MSAGSGSLWPVAVPIAASAVVNVVVAIVVNLATGGGPWWMWVLIAVLTVVGIATAIWQYRRQQASTPQPTRHVRSKPVVIAVLRWAVTRGGSAPATTRPHPRIRRYHRRPRLRPRRDR